jgi:hypothetical protein
MAVEYPQFAERGGYQLAINAKPRFIQKALEACHPRAVLYIDGDMTINQYPHLFDLEDVDMMARGWHIDPRSNWKHGFSIHVDPYLFETSGGTMYFSQSPESKLLLDKWIETSESHIQWGKADDRILSLIFNAKGLLLPMKIIQLPIEYLWLTLDYDDSVEEEYQNRSKIFIEHPECLTSEDTAGGAGASSDRTPKFYAALEETYPRSEHLMERVMFPTTKLRDQFGPYLNYLEQAKYFDDKIDDCLYGVPPFHITKFEDNYGKKFNDIVEKNEEHVKALKETMMPMERGSTFIVTDNEQPIPKILYGLMEGMTVLYNPNTSMAGYTQDINTILTNPLYSRVEFAFVNLSMDKRDAFTFQSQMDYEQPMLFRPGSSQLIDLLKISDSMASLAKMFKNGYQFLSRIRTHYIPAREKVENRQKEQVGGGNSKNISENAYDFLYSKTSQSGGRIQKTRKARKQKQRKYKTRKH